ncbi:MAG: carbohydrate ABC transporter substrate-binding protein [Bacilli bacterium]|jgi:hypothetical protein|nr:carbohydrate ABC transporter substrate-binding protein [Bacilli bacterium]
MKKKLFSLVMVVAAVGLLGSCSGNTSSSTNATDGGKVLNIECWNTEFEGRFRHYCKDMLSNATEDDPLYANSTATDKKWAVPDADGNFTMKDGTKVVFKITDNKNNGYQNALDVDLFNQDQAEADNKVDMFMVEADYALKYVKSNSTCDVIKDIGLTEADMADQYQYTKDIVKDASGNIKGTTWQACPGLYAYRRDIAKDVLGSDDPATVQAALADWTKFNSVAASAKAKGYYMVSGYDDAYRPFSNNVSAPWVDANKKIVVDQKIKDWISQTKTFSEKGYNHGTSLWNSDWTADQTMAGKVFGFFYSTWGINFTLKDNAGDAGFGKWAVCQGPASYYWGGSWISAAKGTDNKSQIAKIMKRMTCDKATLKQITLDTLDYTNNKSAMNEIAADKTYGAAFLGGQNHIALFAKAAETINMSNISAYDQGLNEGLQEAMKDYFLGTISEDKAWENFYKAIAVKYPSLSH